MARVCIDCPTIIPTGTRCPPCTRTRDKARGTRQQRGYGHTHRQLRAELQAKQNAGHTLTCWRCGQPIHDTFHLGHDDHDRTRYRGPEHPACNTATNGRHTPPHA